MNAKRWITVVLPCALLLGALHAHASYTLGAYGIIERVVFEPSADAPERARVYGAFALSGVSRETGKRETSSAERGYLYFSLPSAAAEHAAARREWADLAAVAGTGEAIAFLYHRMLASPEMSREEREALSANPYGFGSGTLQVWPESAGDAAPVRYLPPGVGVVRLGEGNHDDIVAQLRTTYAGQDDIVAQLHATLAGAARTRSGDAPANVPPVEVGPQQSESKAR